MADLLPYNATPQERALSESTARLGAVPVRIREIWSADTCPTNLLAWLAWAFSVDQWDTNWTEAQQRQFIKSSLDIHRYKGTIGAVRDALAALSFDAQVQEWFNQAPAGDPFTFRVLLTVDQVGALQSAHAALFEVIQRTKNLRSHLSAIELTVRNRAGPLLVAASGIGSEIAVAYSAPSTVLNDTTLIV